MGPFRAWKPPISLGSISSNDPLVIWIPELVLYGTTEPAPATTQHGVDEQYHCGPLGEKATNTVMFQVSHRDRCPTGDPPAGTSDSRHAQSNSD